MPAGTTLLLLNSHQDTIDLLSDWFAAQGAIVHYARTLELCRQSDKARALLEAIRPHVILFDLAVPYRQNWECLQRMMAAHAFDAIPVILTTANRRALDELVGPTDAFEILGTPHDLWQLQDLIEWRLAGGHAVRARTRQ